MERLNPRDPAAIDRVTQMITRIAIQWKAEPNIVDILPAVKVTGGVAQKDVLAIGFLVQEKLSFDLLTARGWLAIPGEIEGVPTDVISVRAYPLGHINTRDTRSQLFDTLAGGIAVGNARINAYGTLAMICFVQSDGRPVGLTNEHVLINNIDGKAGDEVQQPRLYLQSEVALESAACCPNGQLRFRGVNNPIYDAAAGTFVAALLAAALSDEIDPHRRGQEATPVDPAEKTVSETVSTQINRPFSSFFSVGDNKCSGCALQAV